MSFIKERIRDQFLYEEAKKLGFTELQARIISNRSLPDGTDLLGFKNPKIDDIPDIGLMKDVVKAAERVADAVMNNEKIGLVCDFDVDGTSSAAVMYLLLSKFGLSNDLIKIFIPNRMVEGYGFSQSVLDRILVEDPPPTLLITADQGSSDGDRVDAYLEFMKKKRKKYGDNYAVIITDHHEIPDSGGPENAYAFVNPQQEDCNFPDKTICGCTVALFLMAAVRHILIDRKFIEEGQAPSLKDSIAFSTAATISDCVSMSSMTNRAIVTQGLEDINKGITPAWRRMRNFVNDPREYIKAESIAFGLGPRINACSRTGGDGLNAIRFYLADSDIEAERFFDMLTANNDERKEIEKQLVEMATEQAQRLIEDGYSSLVIMLKNGHHGIHGIAASRLVERFGKPAIIFSPKIVERTEITREEAEQHLGYSISKTHKPFYDLLGANYIEHIKATRKQKEIFLFCKIITASGSARSVDGLGKDQKGFLSIRDCLNGVQDSSKLLDGYGGHAMAAGMSLKFENINSFREELEMQVRRRVDKSELMPKHWTDGYLPSGYSVNESLLEEINGLEPYGRSFDAPTFTVDARVVSINIVGERKDTAIMNLNIGNTLYKAIWFKFTLSDCHHIIKVNASYRMVVRFTENWFRGVKNIQVQVSYAEPI